MRDADRRYRKFMELPVNSAGRDFFIGDIHDHRTVLQQELTRINFNTKSDRLFLTGDFTCKGPDFEKLWHICRMPWAWSVMGNHEFWLTEWLMLDSDSYKELYLGSGGAWAWDILDTPSRTCSPGYHPLDGYARLQRIALTIAKSCPACIVVNTRCGHKIGVTHAAAPANFSPDGLRHLPTPKFFHEICESFTQYQLLRSGTTRRPIAPGFDTRDGILGVDAAVHGHINVTGVEVFGKQLFIDTLETTGRPTILSAEEIIEMTS